MSRAVRALAIALAVALVVPAVAVGAPSAAKKKGAVHEPPYKAGPSGGDEFNFVGSDPDSGMMMVARTFPGVPPVVGCTPEPSAGWAMFQVKHHVTQPVHSVTLAYDAVLDPYSWITVGARIAHGRWLGVKKLQGPSGGSGKVTAKLFGHTKKGDEIVVEFGLQLGDACPQVGMAAAMFPSVTIR